MKYLKQILLLLLLSATFFTANAQETAAKSFWDDPVNHPLTPLYVVTAFVLIAMLTVLLVAFYLLRILNLLIEQTEEKRAASLGKPYVKRESWWSKLVQQLNASVPVAQEKDIDLGHDYDGIRELDNHLPPWWKWLFYGTIGWSAVYLVVYHLSHSLPLSGEEYQDEVALAERQIQKFKASQPQAVIDESTLAYVNDPAIILADEPTGNLDSATSQEIMALFDHLHRQGNTIILVTHEHDIAEHAHRVLHILDGKINRDERR